MESGRSISSEDDLLKLREDGKISERQCQELLGTIRRSPGDSSRVKSPAEPQFQAFRKRLLVGGLVICILGIIFGVILKLPFVWGLGILGVIVVPIKFYLVSRRQ